MATKNQELRNIKEGDYILAARQGESPVAGKVIGWDKAQHELFLSEYQRYTLTEDGLVLKPHEREVSFDQIGHRFTKITAQEAKGYTYVNHFVENINKEVRIDANGISYFGVIGKVYQTFIELNKYISRSEISEESTIITTPKQISIERGDVSQLEKPLEELVKIFREREKKYVKQ